MKDFLIAIIVLLILAAAFGTIESRIEFDYPFGNWAVPGNTGQSAAGQGEPGEGNAFSFGTAKTQENTPESTQNFCPVTVTVAEQKETAPRPQVLAWVLTGVAIGILAGVYGFAGWGYAQYFKEKKRKKHEENLYQSGPLGKRPRRGRL